MSEWWDIDDEILGLLDGGRPLTPTDVAGTLGMSEAAATSLLARLALEGKVRILGVAMPARAAMPAPEAALAAPTAR